MSDLDAARAQNHRDCPVRDCSYVRRIESERDAAIAALDDWSGTTRADWSASWQQSRGGKIPMMGAPKGEAHRRRTEPTPLSGIKRRRAAPNRPAWAGAGKPGPEREMPERISHRDRIRGLGTKVQAWCYLCGSAHQHGEPCLTGARAKPLIIPSAVCPGCGDTFYHQRGKTRRIYCTAVCRLDTAARRR